MGGLGSGRRWDSKETTSDYVRFDVRKWQRENLLTAGRLFFHWPWDVELKAVHDDEPSLACLYPRHGTGLRCEPQRIWIEWTSCNYGGKRAWFICPRGCGQRVAILYGIGELACRHCRQLSYETQQDSGWKRSLRQARTIRAKLGGSMSLAESLPEKPKGMHGSTYQRLLARVVLREQAVFASLRRVL
jgi:hypothetical protein